MNGSMPERWRWLAAMTTALSLCAACIASAAGQATTPAPRDAEQPPPSAPAEDETRGGDDIVGAAADGAPTVVHWQVAAAIAAKEKPCTGIIVTIPIPSAWPEQEVELMSEDISEAIARVDYRDLEGGARQLVATIPSLRARQTATIDVRFEIRLRTPPLPADLTTLAIPKPPPGEVKLFLNSSPLIDHRPAKLRRLAEEIVKDQGTDWQRVVAIHSWVATNIAAAQGKTVGSTDALAAGKGNNEDRLNVFIALCRNQRIPARFVWVEGGEYAEVYLEDSAGNGYWIPARLSGGAALGSLGKPQVIEQKGENIRVPEEKSRRRYVNEMVYGKTQGPLPAVEFLRQRVPPP
jgi:hypothetical protein